MHAIKSVCICLFIAGFTVSVNADNTNLEIPEGYELVVRPTQKPLEKTLSAGDEIIASAIEKASCYAYLQKDDQMIAFPLDFIKLTLEYCRATWNGKGEFIDYVRQEFNRKKANCDGWFKYYKDFLK